MTEIYDKNFAESECTRIFKMFDSDGNGYIEYEEFLAASVDKKKLLSEKNLKATFKMYDEDDSGTIDKKEI